MVLYEYAGCCDSMEVRNGRFQAFMVLTLKKLER